MQAVKKVLSFIVSVLLWAIILLAALFAFTTLATRDKNSVANIAGYTPMTVQTDSMSPTFNAGDLILIHTCDPSTLEVGDIITFHTIIQNEYALNTHRIAAIDESNGYRSYTTKGDNNVISDTHVIADGDIVGKYVGKVSNLGKVLDFMSSSVGFLIIIVLPMLMFFIYQVYHLIMVAINLKKAVAVENALAVQQAVEAAGGTPAAAAPAAPNAPPAANAAAAAAAPAVSGTASAAAAPAGSAAPTATSAAAAAAPAPSPEAASALDEAARIRAEAEATLAEARRLKAEAEAEAARAEAQAALAEARRMKEEAAAALARAKAETEQAKK